MGGSRGAQRQAGGCRHQGGGVVRERDQHRHQAQGDGRHQGEMSEVGE